MLPAKTVWPKALRKLEQWIQWRIVDGIKVPYQTSPKGKASSTDPNTWTSFYDAYHYYDPDKRDAIGFVLTADDPFVVYDLDHVVDAQGETATWALKMIESLNSLTYRSVSGTGYHIWTRCTEKIGPVASFKWPSLPSTALEIFSERRALVMSGNLYLKTGIKDRTDQTVRLVNKIKAHRTKQALANVKPPTFANSNRGVAGEREYSLRDFLDQHDVDYRTGNTSTADDGVSFKIECPWGHEHTDEKNGFGHAAVFVKGGKWCFSCCHTHDYSWRDFREYVAPKQPVAEFKLSFGRRK